MQPDTEINPLSFFSLNISDYEGGVKMQLVCRKSKYYCIPINIVIWKILMKFGIAFRPV